jgi:protein-S-isoprenylcysteine O-methyltransferase Ste14
MLNPVDPPPKLITEGMYQYSRNPMYIGYFIIILSEFSLSGEILILGYLAVLVIFTQLMLVYVEEPSLEREFGEEYVNYKNRVPRWLPHLK